MDVRPRIPIQQQQAINTNRNRALNPRPTTTPAAALKTPAAYGNPRNMAGGIRMLNGRTYGDKRRRKQVEEGNVFANAPDVESSFVEWGYGGMGSVKATAGNEHYARVQGGQTVGTKESGEDEDDGSGAAWLRKRKEAREKAKKEKEAAEAEEKKKKAEEAEAQAEKENQDPDVKMNESPANPPLNASPPLATHENHHITATVAVSAPIPLSSSHHHHPHHHHTMNFRNGSHGSLSTVVPSPTLTTYPDPSPQRTQEEDDEDDSSSSTSRSGEDEEDEEDSDTDSEESEAQAAEVGR